MSEKDAGFSRSLAPAEPGAEDAPGSAEPLAELLIVSVFVFVVIAGVLAHEPWFDEAQSWLLARDASPVELVTKYLPYEGHPPLWYLVLMPAAALGAPYKTINVISALIAFVGVVMLVRDRRIPLAVRALLPFAYFVAYQYTVVSRSYVLILPILLGILAIYPRRTERVGLFTLLLVLLSNVSLHGLSLAGAFVFLTMIDMYRARIRPTRAHFVALGVLLANVALLALMLRPPADLAIKARLNYDLGPANLLSAGWIGLSSTLFGPNAVSAVALALIAICLARLRTLHVFVILVASLLPIMSVYYSLWHEGLFFLALIFAILLTLVTAQERRWRLALTVLTCAFLLQHLWWTGHSLRSDFLYPYCGSQEAAEYIRKHGIDRKRLFGAGFPSLSVQPYFPRNVFANYQTTGGFSFWDWSSRAPWYFRPARILKAADMRAWMLGMLAKNPDYFLVSDKFPSEMLYPHTIIQHGGYRHIETFPGTIFWKDGFTEPETFHLFERVR